MIRAGAVVGIYRKLSAMCEECKTLQEKITHYRELTALIRDLATNPTMRETFDQRHRHLTRLADEVEHEDLKVWKFSGTRRRTNILAVVGKFPRKFKGWLEWRSPEFKP
jgi:hypothetical protein